MTTNITKIKNVDVDDGRLKMFKFDGSSSFLYLTSVKDPKANVNMRVEIDPSGDESKTLIDSNNYTLEYTPTSIKFRYGPGKNRRKDFDIPAITDFSVIQTVILNFNRIGGTVTGFGPDNNMTTYTSDSNVSGSFNNNKRDNYMYFGKTERNNNYFKGFMGDIKVTNRSQFYVKATRGSSSSYSSPSAAAEAPAPGQICPVKEVVEEEEKPDSL